MSNGGRIALVVTGALATLLAIGIIGGGALALWGDSQKNDDGYLTTDTHRFEAGTRALATDNLDVDLGDADWVADTNDLGKVKISAESREDKPLFVGIARTSDVEDYLAGVPHTTVEDVDSSPFDADYTRHSGQRVPSSPEHAGIWAASNHGSGSQTVDWEIEDGDWSVVVMNADGSLGVDADISAGANVPYLDELGWTAIGSGAFALIIGVGLIALAVRRPRNDGPTGTAPTGDAAPAAA
jgi:hypothetical protein